MFTGPQWTDGPIKLIEDGTTEGDRSTWCYHNGPKKPSPTNQNRRFFPGSKNKIVFSLPFLLYMDESHLLSPSTRNAVKVSASL